MSTYYPLKTGNTWTYKNNNPEQTSEFTNAIVSEDNGIFTMTNSTVTTHTLVKKEGNTFYTDSYEVGNMQPFLKDDANAGDKWDIKYKAATVGGMETIISIEVRSIGGTKEVEGKTYTDVMEMEGVMSFIMNGNTFSANTKYNWFYAKGVGLILTTSSLDVDMPLINYIIGC